MVIFRVGLALPSGVHDRQAGADIEPVGRVEREGAVGAGGFVARVEDRDGGQLDPAVGEAFDVDDGGEFVLALEIDVQAGQQRSVERGHHALVRTEDLLDQKIRIFLRLGDGNDARGEEVVAGEFEGIEDVEGAENIGHETLARLEIAKIVAEEDLVRSFELAGPHPSVALHDLGRAEEFAARGGGELEALRGVDFPQLAEDLVAERFFGMAENVEAPDPAENREADEQEDQNRPAEKPSVLAAARLGGIRIGILEPGAAVFGFLVAWHRVQAPAGSNEVPQPHEREACGLRIRKPAPERPSS